MDASGQLSVLRRIRINKSTFWRLPLINVPPQAKLVKVILEEPESARGKSPWVLASSSILYCLDTKYTIL